MLSERLERVAAELIAIAERMRREDEENDGSGRDAEPGSDVLEPDASSGRLSWNGPSEKDGGVVELHDRAGRTATLHRWCEHADRLYRFRRRRDRLFGSMFGEPAWDILLDLYVSEAHGKRVPVSSACVSAGVSPSTALRQLDELVRSGLVQRERDEGDKRRTYVRLSDEGLHKVAQALEQLGERFQVRPASRRSTVRGQRAGKAGTA